MSVGEAFFPEDGQDAEQLLAEADRRMYKTKQAEKQKEVIPLEQPVSEEALLAG